MSDRITNSMLSSNYLRNMNRNMNNMQILQNQLASGKAISKASDNPYKASRSMQLHAEISYNKQYNENIKDTSNWLDTTDTALSQIGNVFGRIETLLVSAGNGAYGEDERVAIQDEIKEKVNELSQILNTSFDGSYIFGGTKIGSKPVTVDANGKLQYANKKGDAIIPYLNAAGEVTSNSISSNKALTSSDKVYLDSNGKITTSSTATDGTANTQIIQSSSLYVDKTTGIVSTSSSASTNALLLKDELYADLDGNVTPSKTTNNTLITSDNELLYLTSDGKVTTTYDPTYTLIPTGTPFYKGTNGEVTISGAAQNQINQATPIFKDAKGFVTTSSITVNTELALSTVQGMNVSKGDILSTAEPMTSSGDIYIDSRGILTNSSTTDLSMRKATLKDLWNNSYIDSADQQVKTATPIPLPNNQINLYKDSTGQVTTSPGGYPANEQILLGTSLYKNADGKVTTVASSGATLLQLTDTVYVDLNGEVITSSTTSNTPVSVRDNLSISTTDVNAKAKAVIGSVSSPDVVIPSDTINLYIDGSGNITNDGTGANKTKVVLSDSLYRDSYDNITTFPNSQNTLINSDDKLYKDANGNVTNSALNIQIISGTTLYKDSNGTVTTLKGETPPNEPIDLNDVLLYKDGKGNITTVATFNGVANTLIDNKISLYKDVNGNVTTIEKNTQIASDTQLYKTDDGKSVTTEPSGYTFSELIANGINLYRDSSGNLTTSSIGNIQITSAADLYEDPNGNIITLPGNTMSELMSNGIQLYKDPSGKVTTSSSGNTLITSLPGVLYKDSSGNVTTSSIAPNTPISLNTKLSISSGNVVIAPQLNQGQNSPVPSTTKLYIDGTQVKTRLIKTGDPLYADSNWKIITSKITLNTELTASDNIYVDDAGNLTMSSTTANKELTMLDVKNLNSELQDSSTTQQRKIEINKILNNEEIAQLLQLDSNLEVDISQGVKTNYNETAVDILEFKDKNGNSISVSNLLTNIIKDLGVGGNTNNLTTTHLKDIQSVTANLLQQRSEVGSMQNRMESAQEGNETQNYNMTDILSKTEDIDFAEKTMEYSIMQTVYTASLQTSAKILPMTILSYL